MNDEYLHQLYQRDGVLFPLTALSEAETAVAQRQYMEMCPPGCVVADREQRLFGHLLYPWVADLVSHPNVLKVVRSLIGPNVLVWVSEFNAKAPDTNHYFSWHQDLFYWRHQCENVSTIPMVTAWLALFPADPENGCMRVVPGTHSTLAPHVERPSDQNMLTKAQTIEVNVDESQAVPVRLAAGEFSIHHPLLHHASGPNVSDRPRVGLVTRYMAPEVAPPSRPACAWLVSGEDTFGQWQHVAPIYAKQGLALRDKCMDSVQRMTGNPFK